MCFVCIFKLSTLKSTRGEADGQMVALKEELEDMKVWKNKVCVIVWFVV